MADDELPDSTWLDEDATDHAIMDSLKASALGPLANQVDGVAKMIVEYANREQGTNLFNRWEATLYAKMRYLEELVKAVEVEDTKGFQFPDFEKYLIKPDYQLRTSVKQQTRKILESITKIFERGAEGRRGGFFGRRG